MLTKGGDIQAQLKTFTMTIQDLTKNKARIIRNIRRQSISDIKTVMTYMVKYLPINDKPLMKNIDELTSTCIGLYFRNDYNKSMTTDEMTDYINKDSLPSSLR